MSSQAGVAWALSRVGLVESPANSNKGPQITQWEVNSGYPWVPGAPKGVPWCQCFANAAAVAGGAPQLDTGFTPAVMVGIGDFHPIDVHDAEQGDFIFFKWPGVSFDRSDHVGVLQSKTSTTVTCIEGNTSKTINGSQNNGGGVFVRTRSRSLVVGAVRVPYKADAYRNLLLGMQGSDVRAFQVAINERADGCGRQDRRVTVDGHYGSETKENGAWAGYLLGLGDSTDELKSGGISTYVQELVRDPDKRNDEQKSKAGPRRQAYCR